MRITFLGGADEVGASSTLLEIAGRRILVDAGIRISPKARWGLAGDSLPDLGEVDRAGGVDAILVTHAHTDHTGALELVAERYGCPVYATPVTIALTRVLHADSRRIMQSRLDEEGELPLFDDLAVEKLMASFVPVPFETRLPLGGGAAATFFPAGHIAGAAMIGIESDEGRILFSGDLSISPQRTVDGARVPPFRPDVVVLESTYGGRLHANRAAEERRLAETVAEVTAAGGKVLIPAFALGRAQEVILILSEFQRRGRLAAPVWVDGMVRAICGAYTQFPEALPLALQERGARFFDERTQPVLRPDQRNALAWAPEPAVIVASSGMLAGGASVQYARALADGPQHAILLTGYQDEESPGRKLQEMAASGRGTLRLGRDRVEVKCRLGTYSLSAHADEGQLVSLVEALDPPEVVLAHGDEAAQESLARRLAERGRHVRRPYTGESLELRFAARPATRRQTAIGGGRPFDARLLWEGVAGPAGGGYFAVEELARAWWGAQGHVSDVEDALAGDDLYFLAEASRPGIYRARTAKQIEAQRARRETLAAWRLAEGHLAILGDGDDRVPRLARVVRVAPDRLFVQGDPEPHWPEAILEAFPGEDGIDLAAVEALAAGINAAALLPAGVPRSLAELATGVPEAGTVAAQAATALALLRAGARRTPGDGREYLLEARPSPVAGAMEPNQALAYVRGQFPPEARLRRAGYRAEERTLALTFDFPDTAAPRYQETLGRLTAETGWKLEVTPEPNQGALRDLARLLLEGLGLTAAREPAIYREERRIAVATAGEAPAPAVEGACREYLETTGYALSVVSTGAAPSVVTAGPAEAGPAGPWEINAACSRIRAALAGSTLYRTSVSGGAITLSFISPQVGERHREEITALARETGWELQINPRPNQEAVLQAARRLAEREGWEAVKGPGLRLDRGVVEMALAGAPDEGELEDAAAALEAETGYRLALVTAGPAGAPGPAAAPAEAVDVPLERIRLSRMHEGTPLNPAKALKAVERARRLGRISPPIQLRRLRDGYLLLDGLYRLHAARTLGWESVAALVEE